MDKHHDEKTEQADTPEQEVTLTAEPAAPEPEDTDTDGTDAPEQDTEAEDTEADSFPREYVQRLREESKQNRIKAKDRDDIAARLHYAQVQQTGRLADPSDLPYDEALLDPDALSTAIDDLLAAKPHLAARVPRGDVGQGAASSQESFSLADWIRQGA